MKSILLLLVASVALAMAGCDSGETTQEGIEADAKKIQLDPDAKPDPRATSDMSSAPPRNTGN